MSQENVEAARRAYAAFNDGDLGTVPAIFDPDIEWNASDVFFDQVGGLGRRSGATAMARVAHVLTFMDGRVVRFVEFKDVGKAHAAVGLSEQSPD